MTTVISNGYYFIADHRRGTTTKSSVRNLINYHHHPGKDANVITRKKEIYTHADIGEKIFLLPTPLPTSKYGNVIAMAGAGKAMYIDRFIKAILHYLKDSHIPNENKQIAKVMQYIRLMEIPKEYAVLFVTDTHHTLHFSTNKDEEFGLLEVNDPGEVIGIGSGYHKLKNLSIPVQKIHPKDLFLMAQYMDPYTSPSYGALGLKEKHYYPLILEDKAKRDKASKDLIIKYLKANGSNDYKSIATAGIEAYDLV